MKLEDIIKQSFSQYSAAVIQSRALVDARDALKPSARQIFYSMLLHKLTVKNPHKKTANAVGLAMADFYIHGDSSCEGVIMRAAQPFAMRYPLADVKGNCGSLIKSGNWAASRYTESRLSTFSSILFDNIDKETITEWRDNYDNTKQFPGVLPTMGYYNIVNGTGGIAVGMASSIPQFNLKDVNHALEVLLLNPNCDFNDIYCPPDFATGAYLINENEVKESLKNGNGKACKLRAKIDYDKVSNTLIVTEIPYGVYTNTICEELEGILESEDNPGIDKFNDLTGTTPLIKIYLTKSANPAAVTKYLYKKTSLQYYYGINMTMLDGGKYPKVFTWKEALQAHIDHEKEVYRRAFEYDLRKIKSRIHIIDGLLICLASIDEVVKTIKSSKSTAEAASQLQTKFLLDEPQSKAVLEMKLARLAHLEVEKLKNEREQLLEEAKKIEEILNIESKFFNVLVSNWRKIAMDFGDEHRTKIISVAEDEEEDNEPITAEDVVVMVSRSGKIKRVAKDKFKAQRKNGKGVRSKEEAILTTLSTNTIDTIMFFTNRGKAYRLPVNDIPDDVIGIRAETVFEFEGDEELVAAINFYKRAKSKYVMFFTKNGLVKKTAIEEFFKTKGKNNRIGLAAIKLADTDSIANVIFIDNEDVIVITKNGMGIKFPTKEISPVGRIAMGVKAITLAANDKVLNGMIIENSNDYLAIVNEKGIGKRTSLAEFSLQNRGGKGVICGRSGAPVADAAIVAADDTVLLCGKPNSICIEVKDIPILSRTGIGNQLIKDSKVNSMIKL